MIEFTSNHHGIGIIEKALQGQVAKGVARCIKNSRRGEFETKRYIGSEYAQLELLDKQDLRDRGFNVTVYSQYLLKVGSGLIFQPYTADIRFWYDNRTKVAGIKISEDTLIAIMQTTGIVSFLHKLDVSLGGGKNGKMTLEKVAALLTNTIDKVDPNAKAIFSVQKK
jgi:hypothetical protein